MGRYDWPASPESTDDPAGRGRHVGRYLPSSNVRQTESSVVDVPAPPTPTPKRSSRPVPKVAPSGNRNIWLPIGPTSVVKGQATGEPNVSGRVRDLQADTATGDRVYAATGGGGVWMSIDRGRMWEPLHEFVVTSNRTTFTPVGNSLACGALYVQFQGPADGSGDRVVLGTGEPGGFGKKGNPGGRLLGVGILELSGPPGNRVWAESNGGGALRGHVVWRIVASPNDPAHLFAATSNGLWMQVPGGAWTRLPSAPAGVADVVVTSKSATVLRVWVVTFFGLHMAEIGVLPAATGPATFTPITLGKVRSTTRKVLAVGSATELWVLGRRAKSGDEKIDPAYLWRVNPSAATATATEITGAPPDLFGATHDQSDYDMCLTVHPDHADRLFAGGSAVDTHNQWNGAIYQLTVTGNAVTPTYVGLGTHSDVHVLRVGGPAQAPGPDRCVWVGCDGGVFLSRANGRAGTFDNVNNQIATLEPGYIACHPTNDGIVAAGMQDNGTCERIGDTLWMVAQGGDGGGIAFDPTHSKRYFRQYVKATWSSSDGTGVAPVHRHDMEGDKTSEYFEDKQSLFYSGAASLFHGGTTHLAFGSDRPWYSQDWGQHWVTVPSGTDPRETDNVHLAIDLLKPSAVTGQYTDSVPTFLCCHGDVTGNLGGGSAAITVKLSPADNAGATRVRLHALWDEGMSLLLATKPTAPATKWTWASEQVEVFRPPNTPAEIADVAAGNRLTFLPASGLVSDMAVHRPDTGAHGSCYVGTIGAPDFGVGAVIDTLWWYDGAGQWVPCGLRRVHSRGRWTGNQIVSPVLSIAVDPTNSDIVYVGTSVGVVRGVLTFTLVSGVQEPHWDWQPFDIGLPEAAVNDLAIYQSGSVKLLRAALQARGVWEVDLANETTVATTYLRVYPSDTRRRIATELTGPTTAGETGLRFDASPDIVFDDAATPFGAQGPTEAEVYHLTSMARRSGVAAQVQSSRTFTAHVLVHHRWWDVAPAAQVKVALLRHDIADSRAGLDVPLGGLWAVLLAIAQGGAVPAVLPDGWAKAGAQLIASVGAPINARLPRAASFNVDLGTHGDGAVMFLAVVMSAPDPLTAADGVRMPGSIPVMTVRELVLNSRHAAARSLQLN